MILLLVENLLSSTEKRAIVIATQRGAIKKMKLSEFEIATRAKRGVVLITRAKNESTSCGWIYPCG